MSLTPHPRDELLAKWQEAHCYEHALHLHGERRTRLVVIITALMMGFEIVAGSVFGSMALLADGWHMGSHAGALGIALFAYAFARRHAKNPQYSFGTGKVNALGGFASAIVLGVVALLMIWESSQRLFSPVHIDFDEALLVAVAGLIVNGICAWLLGHEHESAHHDHDHGHVYDASPSHAPEHPDHNLRAAYAHVLADALTSVLAIAALLAGKLRGWVLMDPAIGIVGALVILRWAFQLVRTTSRDLLDAGTQLEVVTRVRSAFESAPGTTVCDLHVWTLGPGHMAVMASVASDSPREPETYKRLLAHMPEFTHVTVEVNAPRAS